jgi:hypothetical protein
MRHPYRTVGLTIAAVVLLTGCSNSYTFNLLLTVTNQDDGQPVEGVTVVLDTAINAEEQKQKLDAGSLLDATSAEGKLTHRFNYAGYFRTSGPWYLKLQKEGFVSQVIDVSPKKIFLIEM